MLDSLERRHYWLEKHAQGYIIGIALFELGSAYVRHDRLQELFRREGAAFVATHNEVVQLRVRQFQRSSPLAPRISDRVPYASRRCW
jgi:DNA-binding IclR family transcriptional regulator